jgi:hypothetical protein
VVGFVKGFPVESARAICTTAASIVDCNAKARSR